MSHSVSTRREFVRSAIALAALPAAAPYFFSARSARAEEAAKNDRPGVGLIGAGGRGMDVAQWAAKFGDIVSVCDVDLRQAEKAKTALGGKAEVCQDYRRLLDRKDVDVVINGTPDHWHTAINIAACRAGKDVYAEKPLTLTIAEGKLLCKVVKDTSRIVQVGTMQRSIAEFQTAVELVRNGRIGKLRQVWVALPYYTTTGGPFPSQPVPKELDWDLYQGQAPLHDYCPQRTLGNFRWWYEYAGGIITDWGNHHVDIAHWGMDCDLTGPTSVEARALFPNPKGPEYYNTPDRFFSRMVYPNGVEVLYFSSINERARYGDVGEHQATSPAEIEQLFGKDVPEEIKSYDRNGILFLGEKGKVFVNRGGVHGKAVDELKDNPLPADAWRVYPSSDHMANFFDCVKTRKSPCTPVEVEHRTVSACHLTNISIRLGRKLAWDPVKEEIVGDDEANAWQTRGQRAGYLIPA
ncbi:MAG: Gfo/Idh/MocA family oxidoreductase [Planctomycetia bacterium]|nr:Gfo/Idh/MocA family oxidoreductase [Planctomycetia bacterium]